ncbi:MAG: ATP-binding protein [Algoriphagus sp.]|uniref:hybrid sensor histidine kinase/response regulator n=1 Tax=Algoriphagus sp. TaxID=1872435 RepID=UPI002603AAB9|nr:ATP-binding protein [Algoriphagus sp.]MDG1276820.1 ATP-binding protein [Algoriphagus sp.]
MKKLTPKVNTASKVIIGFFFAAIFLIGISGLTYYTLNRMLETMDELSQPNQKLNVLNELQTEIIQITQVSQGDTAVDIRVKDSTVLSLNSKLDQLEALALDTLESGYIKRIRGNIPSLVTGYLDLYEVKNNLANRNFTQEALRKVELGIRRRASLAEIQPLKRINPQEYLLDATRKPISTNQELQITESSQVENKLVKYLQDLQNQNYKELGQKKPQALDSVLYGIRNVIKRIYWEESSQRQKLASMESELSLKQSEIVGTIQNLVATLQKRALEESNQKNESAYGLSYDVTMFLIVIVIIAIFGISLMIYSILKEIKLTKRYQENLFESQQKAEDLARSKQEFLANMSHEIRNPLHVIQGYRSVLEKSELDLNQQSQLRMIGYASDTLMEIVDEVLDFSKLEAGKLKLEIKEFDPELLFESIQNFFELKAVEKQLEFKWEMELPEGKSLIGDQLRLKQILNNLLSNAFKFTIEGTIEVKIKWGNDTLTVEIKDTGIGMSKEVLKRVFLEFDQADTSISRKYGGTGLGLAIVQRLITLIGGTITAESAENVGTKMTLSLPLLAGDAIQERTDSQAQSLDLTGLQILLADDDPVGIKYLETILNYFGASCICYNGGVSFRDDFKHEHFDLAILDIQMPEYSGFDVVKKLRSFDQYKQLPILAMTANVFVEERESLLNAGFDDLLIKPFQENALIDTIGKYFTDRVLNKNEQKNSISEFAESYQLSDLRRFCMDDEQLLNDIISELVLQTRKELQELKKAWLNNRFENILEISHQMASRLGQIKSPASRIARKIETNLKMSNKNGLAELLSQLDKEVGSLLDELSRRPILVKEESD